MNKAIPFIAVFCLLMVSVAAYPIVDVESPTIVKKVPINVDGLKGEVSIMTTSGQLEPVTAVENRDTYLGCAGKKRWLWDNAIDISSRSHYSVGDYRLDVHTCQLMRYNEVERLERCEGESKVGKKSLWDSLGNFLGRTTRYQMCLDKSNNWEVVDTSKPVA